MPEITSYESANTFIGTLNLSASGGLAMPNPIKQLRTDPVSDFVRMLRDAEGTVRGWMTYTPEDRLRLVQRWKVVDLPVAKGVPLEQRRKETPVERTERLAQRESCLLAVLYQELTHPNGSKDVAAAAFDFLWMR